MAEIKLTRDPKRYPARSGIRVGKLNIGMPHACPYDLDVINHIPNRADLPHVAQMECPSGMYKVLPVEAATCSIFKRR